MRLFVSIAMTGFLTTRVLAADLELSIEVPRLDVAEYHRPYVAVWLETKDQKFVTNLVVWYAIKNAKNDGDTWLKDLKQWWRKAGRELKVPVDGLTGATRPAGSHTIKFDATDKRLAGLPAGDYRMVVEAAREVGGREIVRLPLSWPVAAAAKESVTGADELGAVTLSANP